ncbi:MAG: response regulator transcription factor [Candidatus Riflebacteria bacterium]|nr:response regulator transcription factor [Candidatus Riflebacteria bacterium]
MEIRILLADDHKILREGLKNLLDKHSGIKVVGEASDGMQAIELADQLNPQVIIMDISMPLLNGIEASRKILQKNSDIHIIALSMHSDRRFVIEVLKAGVKGYVLKDSAFEELYKAINTVLSGQVFLSSAITDIVVRELIQQTVQAQVPSAFAVLSSREREILQLFTEGKSTKSIATCLKISVKTVETHRKQIMDKLDIHTIAELTKYAIREGLTTL